MPDVLHFKGRHDFDRDWLIGPDFGRRYLLPRKVEYNPETDISTITLRGIMPDELRERVTPLVAAQREHERIRKVFNG